MADNTSTFTEPSGLWTRWQSLKGTNWTYVDPDSVPGAAKNLTGKWVVITGGNNGIGREAALKFASNGANLVLGCREPPAWETHPLAVVDECKEKATAKGLKPEIEWWEINMADIASVEAFAKRWLDTGRALDILCNNAGMGSSPGGSDVFKTKDGFEIIHQVNFLSHTLLTLRLLPSLAKALEPRVVCTTSCFHYRGNYDLGNWNGRPDGSGPEGVQYYQNNKLYFQIWLTELQRLLIDHPRYRHITVNGLHPGYVNSGIWNLNRPGANNYRTKIVKFVASVFGINSLQGSLAIIHVALSPECGPNKEVQGVGLEEGKGGGRYFNRIWEAAPMPHCKDDVKRMEVWGKVAEELELEKRGLLKGLEIP